MAKDKNYWLNLINQADADEGGERYRQQLQAAEAVKLNNGGATTPPSLPTFGSSINTTASLPAYKTNSFTGNTLSDRILFTTSSGQGKILPGSDNTFAKPNTTPVVNQPQSADKTVLDRLGLAGSSIVGNIAAGALMTGEGLKQTLINRNENSKNELYRQYTQKISDIENQIDKYKEENKDAVIVEQLHDYNDFTYHGPKSKITYSPDLQALYDQKKQYEKLRDDVSTKETISKDSLAYKVYDTATSQREEALEGLDPKVQFLAGTGLSIADNFVTLPLAAINPALPLGVMGVTAAGNRMGELTEQGVEASEALVRGIASGAIEYATEKVPLDNLLKVAKKAPNNFKEALANVLKQAGQEATEESISYVSNYVIDKAANDPNAEFSLQDLALNALGGAISGGVMGAGGTVYGKFTNKAQTEMATNKPEATPNIEKVQNDAQPIQNSTETAQDAHSTLQQTEKPSLSESSTEADIPTLVNPPIEQKENPTNKTHKIQNAESKAFSELSKKIQNMFGLTRSDVNEYVKDAILQVKDQMQQSGKIDSQLYNDIFEVLWNKGIATDTFISDQYTSLAHELKNINFDLQTVRKHLGNRYNDFRYESRDILGLKKNGNTKIDSAYNDLYKQYPNLFKDENIKYEQSPILSESDQLEKILDVANMIQPKKTRLDQQSDEAFMFEYKRDFQQAFNSYLSEMERLERIHQENLKHQDSKKMDSDTMKALLADYYQNKREYEMLMRNNVFSPDEKAIAENIAKGKQSIESLNGYKNSETIDVNNVKKIVEYQKKYLDSQNAQKQYKKMIRSERLEKASEMIQGMFAWKDKASGLQYNTETAERNIRDIVATPEEAQMIIDEYFTPIHTAEAESNKFKNTLREKVRALNLSKIESEYVQRLGEGDVSIADVAAAGLDTERIQNAVNVFREIYDELFHLANDKLVANGYDPLEYRKDYFPHFQEVVEYDSIIDEIKEKVFGIKPKKMSLDTSIAGITETFRPGKRWVGNFLRRNTNKTTFDALKGFDQYLDGVADVIYQTDNIQKLRALEYQIRYENSEEYIQNKIDEINNNLDLDENERYQKINELLDNQEATRNFGNLVTWINQYTNNLANKKSMDDRVWEYNLGRSMYNSSKSLQGRIASNMVAISPSSWFTNFIPISQASAECSHTNIALAMLDTVRKNVVSDNVATDSTFLTNRKGSEGVSKGNKIEELSKFLSSPMQIIDNFTSEVVVRAKYYQNLEDGMNNADALKNADSYAASLIADRSKGAVPIAFKVQNPVYKAVMQFQLEQNNQFRYMFKDLPRNKQDEAVAAVIMGLVKLSVDAWVFNNMYEWFFGRRPAFDPIDIAFDSWDVITDEEMKLKDKVTEIGTNVVEELPFVGGLMGGGRLPVSSALPSNPAQILDLLDGDVAGSKKNDILLNQVFKPASYLMMPFGAGQVNKTIKGLRDYAQGASYNYTNDGEKLKYTIDQNPLNLARAIVGGSSAFPESVDYWESDSKMMSVKDTDTFELLKEEYGNHKALEKVYELKAIESAKNEAGKTIQNSKSYLVKEYIDSLDITKSQKEELYDQYNVSETVQNMSKEELQELRKKIYKK